MTYAALVILIKHDNLFLFSQLSQVIVNRCQHHPLLATKAFQLESNGAWKSLEVQTILTILSADERKATYVVKISSKVVS
jgi:hypothetical protein